VPEPENGISWLAEPQTEAALAAVRRSVHHGRTFGSGEWVEMVVRRLELQAAMCRRGRAREERGMMKELSDKVRPLFALPKGKCARSYG
jgi:hypothetical protein